MKTLILNGSPRKNGDTAHLTERLRESLGGEVMQIDAYRCAVSPCIDCRYCRSHAGCAIDDGMREVYDFIEDCDNIVIASPLYFAELTGKLLDLASRLQTYFSARNFRGEELIEKPKRGAVILVGGGDGGCKRAFTTAKILLGFMNCTEICDPVASLDTDRIPAAHDEPALAGVDRIAAFLNREI